MSGRSRSPRVGGANSPRSRKRRLNGRAAYHQERTRGPGAGAVRRLFSEEGGDWRGKSASHQNLRPVEVAARVLEGEAVFGALEDLEGQLDLGRSDVPRASLTRETAVSARGTGARRHGRRGRPCGGPVARPSRVTLLPAESITPMDVPISAGTWFAPRVPAGPLHGGARRARVRCLCGRRRSDQLPGQWDAAPGAGQDFRS
jgi:hypothetical protein